MATSTSIDTVHHQTPTRRVTSNEEISSSCNGCSKIFDINVTILEAMGRLWHIECFKCVVCKVELPEYYYEKDNVPFCKDHYYEKLAHKCYQCSDYITGPTMAMGFSRLYHPECFHCTICGLPLGERDTYCLLSTKAILCNTCSSINDVNYEEHIKNGQLQTYVSIQHVKISLQKKVKFRLDGKVPEFKEKRSTIKKFTAPKLPCPGQRNVKHSLKIERLPRSLEGSPIKTGDVILEINGIPIIDQDQDEINSLMKAYSDCVYLTIERKQPVIHRMKSRDESCDLQTESSAISLSMDNPSPKDAPTPQDTPPQIIKSLNSFDEMEHFNTLPVMRSKPIDPSTGEMSNKLFSPTRASISNIENNSFKMMRSHRAQSVPAIDARAEYTQCFRLSDLEIGEVIGRGFYGNVVKVTHKHTKQVMVMKEMINCTDEAKKTFSKEVQMLKNLNHPNILHFIGILYQEGKLLTLITEFIGGGTLRRTIKNLEWQFPWELRISIARDIAAGMSYLHQKGIIHRDLTSKNCLLRKNMTAVVADFGLARVFQPLTFSNNSDRKRALRMTVVGSPYWMAPEMLKGGEYDERVDIFSYGIVTCEIISRVKADPDQMPRLNNFGLDVEKFRHMKSSCPLIFYDLAIKCTSLSPDERPNFDQIENGLNHLVNLIESNENIDQLPEDFYHVITQSNTTCFCYHIN